MFSFFELIIDLAIELCSWQVWLCILLAIGIIVGLYFKYPEHDGLWSVSYPAAIIITAFGFWWQYRADR